MKKTTFYLTTFIFCSLLALFSFSCSTLSNLFSASPEISLQDVDIKSIDFEGITFSCDYAISNPYPVAIDLQEVVANIIYEENTLTKINTDNGVSIAAQGEKANKLSFKVPYDSVIEFAKSVAGKKSLPFKVSGSASLDLSNVTSLKNAGSLTLPFTKKFDVPVFKPNFSVSNVQVQLPTLEKLRNSLINSGMGLTKAVSVASSIMSSSGLPANTFDGIDLDIDLLFDLNVANEGDALWELAINSCQIQTSAGSIADAGSADGSSTTINSSGTIPMKASLNTLQAGAFIVQMLNKSGSNPVFTFDSGLTFENLPYKKALPLAYSYEIPLSQITRK